MNKKIPLLCCLFLSGCAPDPAKHPCHVMEVKSALYSEQQPLRKPVVDCNAHKEVLSPPPEKEAPIIKKATPEPKAMFSYPQNVVKNMALETCKGAITASLYSPSSFEQDISKTTVKIIGKKDGATLKIPFTAKTGAGGKVNQTAYCVIDKSGEIIILNMLED